ncbi:pilus assembly protein TadG-related protein [Actinoplanes sp. NPDC051494]|uniref:pilus assembly protein TadG-related protein n=1 Tax=Actinoplanes sp. NPDC051494 TaxID=3363907 RepID=UPI0037ACAC7B
MRRLTRADDEGAVAVLVAVLLAGGVLIGLTGLVVDVGGLYAKREQLQSGADAAAWAVAEACVENPDTCTNAAQQPTVDELVAAQLYGPRPNNDTSAALAGQVCVDGIDCAVWNTDVECPSLRLTFGDYVEVRAYYQDAGNLTMPAPLSGRGTTVGACSRVSWGPADNLEVTALGIAASCVPDDGYRRAPAQAGESAVVPMRSLPPATAADDIAIRQVDGSDDSCGYAWLDGDLPARDCRVTPAPPEQVTVLTLAQSQTPDGTAWMSACGQAVSDARNRAPLLVAIYGSAPPADDGTVHAGPGQVTVVGFAAFQPTGGIGDCSPYTCLTGYFTRVLAPRSQPRFIDDVPGDYGVTVIGRTG